MSAISEPTPTMKINDLPKEKDENTIINLVKLPETEASASNSSILAESESSCDFVKSPSMTSSDNDLEKEGTNWEEKIKCPNDMNKIIDNEGNLTTRNDLKNLKQESIESLINKYATNKKYPSASNINIYSGESHDPCNSFNNTTREASKSIYKDDLCRRFTNIPNHSESRIIKINLLTDHGSEYKGIESSVDKSFNENLQTSIRESETKNKVEVEQEEAQTLDLLSSKDKGVSQKDAENEKEHSEETSLKSHKEVEEKLIETEGTSKVEVSESKINGEEERKEINSTSKIEKELESVYEKGRVVEKEDTYEVLLNVKRFLQGKMSVRSKGHYTFLVEAEADNKDDPGSKISLTKRFFIPGRVDMQKTSTSLSSDGILVITVPKLPPLKIKATSDIDRQLKEQKEINEESSTDYSSSKILLDKLKARDADAELREDKYRRQERSKEDQQIEDDYDSDEDVASRIRRKADKYANHSKEELGKEWGEIRNMDKKYKEWLDSRSRDEKYKEWFETKSKEEKQKDWFDTLSKSKWNNYNDFFDAKRDILKRFDHKTKHSFDDDWFDRDDDWFDELTKKEFGMDWFESKNKSKDKFDSFSDRFGAKTADDFFSSRTKKDDISSSRFDRDKDFSRGRSGDERSHLTKDGKNQFATSEVKKQVFVSESSETRNPSFESSSKYYSSDDSKSSSRDTGARSKEDDLFQTSRDTGARRKEDDLFQTARSKLDSDQEFGSRTRNLMEEMRSEFHKDSDDSFEFPIIKRGRFFQDSCFDDARDDFSSVIERFFDRKKGSSSRFEAFEGLKSFDDLSEKIKGRRRPNAVVTEDEDCYKVEVPVAGVDEDSLTVKELAGNEILIEGRVKSGDQKAFKKQIMFPLYGRADFKSATSTLSTAGLLIITIPKTVTLEECKKTLENDYQEKSKSHRVDISQRGNIKNKYKNIFSDVENLFDEVRLKAFPDKIFTEKVTDRLHNEILEKLFDEDLVEMRKRKRRKEFLKREECKSYNRMDDIFGKDIFNFSTSARNLIDEILPKHFSKNICSTNFRKNTREKYEDPFSINFDKFFYRMPLHPVEERNRRSSDDQQAAVTKSQREKHLKEEEETKKCDSGREIWYKVEMPVTGLREETLTVTEQGENTVLVEAEKINGEIFTETIHFPENCDIQKIKAILSVDGTLSIKVPRFTCI